MIDTHRLRSCSLLCLLVQVLQRLTSEGMNEVVEDKLINMSRHLIKTNKQKSSSSCFTNLNLSETNGRIELSKLRLNIVSHSVPLTIETGKEFHVSEIKILRFWDYQTVRGSPWLEM